MIEVGVFGAKGRMGSTVCEAVEGAPDMELVARIDAGDDRAPAGAARVMVDFTRPDAVMDDIEWCIDHGVNAVVGTTGFDDERLDRVRSWLGDAPRVGVLIASNFSIGAVLMMAFAEKAAPFFDSAEIVELHHPRKLDAPSGTAASTARRSIPFPSPPSPPAWLARASPSSTRAGSSNAWPCSSRRSSGRRFAGCFSNATSTTS